MNSKERHEARYQRREAARLAKRQAFIEQFDNFDRAVNRNALSKACHDAALSVGWKSSVKRFRYHKLTNIKRLSDKLEQGKSVHKNFICFDIVERGKERHIMSVRFSERVVHKAVCQNVLYPVLTRNLIFDNCANQKGKGTHLARRRVKTFLSSHFRRYGREGYVLLIDFKSFFENLDHTKIKEILLETIKDELILKVCLYQLDDYARYYKRPIGLGLGSEQNQIYAVILPNVLDHFIKEKLRIKGYVRYMDDMILIHRSKLYLEECLKEIREVCSRYGLIINERKTGIVKLSRGFTYLKTQYKITDTGHIVMKAERKSITRERHKLKKQAALYLCGEMSIDDIRTSYASWRGSLLDRDSYRTIKQMDAYYKSIFEEVKENGSGKD